jgi:F-type H+-transporting ATPase subunit epsilon
MADETNQLRVRLVTPERTLFESDAPAVVLPAKNGYMEVLYGHAPLMAELGVGDVIVRGGPKAEPTAESAAPRGDVRYNVNWGFVEVLPGRVTILASDALKPEEIDVQRAEQQLDRGRKMWLEAGENQEAYTEAQRIIVEAEAKIASAGAKIKTH